MNIKMLKVALAGLLLSVSGFANAGLIQYDDRTVFGNATASSTTETFNGFLSDVSLAATTYDVGDFSIITTLNNAILKIDADGVDNMSVNGTAFVRGVGLNGDTFSFDFDNNITSFGVDLFGFNNDSERTKVFIDGNEITLPIVTGDQNSFFGITSTIGFSSVTFSTINSEDGGFDNITYGIAKVPEPATLAIFALGIMGLASRRFKKH